jgi:hypothetical protein
MNEDFVRCKPCGFVIKANELGDVCPACGMNRSVFEPYHERVSANRKFILSLDIHPIAIHLSQTFVTLIPLLILFQLIFPRIETETLIAVTNFSIYALPFTLILSTISGTIDGYTRFKTFTTPLLRVKIILSSTILGLSFIMFYITKPGEFTAITLIISLFCFACAIKLGLWGKKLINPILPGSIMLRKKGNA